VIFLPSLINCPLKSLVEPQPIVIGSEPVNGSG